MTTETPPSAKGTSFIKLRDTRRAVARAGAYTKVIGKLRWILPISAVMILAALILWPMVGAKELKSMADKSVPNLVIENLRLTGVDAKNEPYKLTAKRALQVPDSKGIIDLEQPQGELSTQDGAWLAGQANQGRYDQTGKKLWLGGNVELFHDNGLQFHTSEAQVDLNKNNAWGSQPVVIQGGFGEIHGQGFRMMNGGKVVVVTGRSKALLHLHTASASDTNGQ